LPLRNALVRAYGDIDDDRVLAAVPLAVDGFDYLRAVQRWAARR
jgi:uncharacterized protein YutE (UPF0331/DUF86 family)